MKQIVLVLILMCQLFAGHDLLGQSNIPIGSWASHLPHASAKHVTQSNEYIIYGTDQSIFTIDKETQALDFVSKVEGLTETGISDIDYDLLNDQLIIAYDNSVIDLVSGSTVYPIFDIKNNSNFLNRRINEIFIQNAEWVYFATGFGLVQYNLQTRRFGFTLDAGEEIFDVTGNDKNLFITAASGIYTFDLEQQDFPNAFSEWTLLDDNFQGNQSVRLIHMVNDALYVCLEEAIFKSIDFDSFNLIYTLESGFQPFAIKTMNGGWYLGLRNGESSRSKVLFFDEMDTPIDEISGCTNRLIDVAYDEANGAIYFADQWDFIRYIDTEGNCKQEVFKGPFGDEATDIEVEGDVVYVASGGVSESFADLFGRRGIYILDDNNWNNINEGNNSFFRDKDGLQFFQIEAHPDNDKIYIGSYWAGLFEYDYATGEQVHYIDDNTNGALGRAVGDEARTRVSGMTFDNEGNLWVACWAADKPLSVFTKEGTWHSFSINADSKLSDLVVDNNGYVWGVIAGNNGGVIVYDPGESIQDPTDDGPMRFFNFNNSEISSNIVNSIAVDLDGAVWVGTAEGAIVFECGSGTFDSDCIGNRRRVLQDSIVGFLLQTEEVNAIAVDGANRKWFGTRNGIFVQSASGEEQIFEFNEDNSPLFDNNIKALGINGNSGEVFIATDRGLQSYRSGSTSARTTHASTVYAFPNPVRPGYNGKIAIKGLARDAEVKITDIDGQLVYQTTALGGTALWDGTDPTGRQVVGGVYLVFSSSVESFQDPDAHVTKILVVR